MLKKTDEIEQERKDSEYLDCHEKSAQAFLNDNLTAENAPDAFKDIPQLRKDAPLLRELARQKLKIIAEARRKRDAGEDWETERLQLKDVDKDAGHYVDRVFDSARFESELQRKESELQQIRDLASHAVSANRKTVNMIVDRLRPDVLRGRDAIQQRKHAGSQPKHSKALIALLCKFDPVRRPGEVWDDLMEALEDNERLEVEVKINGQLRSYNFYIRRQAEDSVIIQENIHTGELKIFTKRRAQEYLKKIREGK